MSQSILSRRTVFGISTALLILLVFFFMLPSAFRGARLAVAGKKNNIKDWLPSDFRETVELEWFANYFMGESFVLATWDGCTMADQRLELFAAKLRHESAQRKLPDSPDHQRARALAEELQLFIEPASTQNWGGLNEKWFASPTGRFYFITPDGRFYRWEEGTNAVGGGIRAVRRALGRYTLEGQFIAAFGGEPPAGGVNEFYNDPALLAASLFQTVETGGDMVARLAAEGGPLWPIDLTDVQQRSAVAQQRAIERLTGTLFAPAVPYQFDWTPAAVYEQLPESSRAQLPEDYQTLITQIVTRLEQQLGVPLARTTTDQQGVAWDALCNGLGIPTPPRQTCILVTLTPLGKEHLARAVGRGVVGGPRGRLLILGDESGLSAAQPPSMAPPPFDRNEDPALAAGGRALLRTGGPPIDNVAIDEEGTVTLVRLVGYSGLVGLFVAFVCFRSVNLTIMIFLVGVSAGVLGLAITYWTGGIVDAILMTMPSLLYVLGLSGAIHIVNYYRDEVREQGIDGAAGRALRHAIVPCSLAALTTALGLASLSTSNILPIYNFGIYTAASVVATLVILFTYLPAALETFAPRFALRASAGRESIAGEPTTSGGDAEPELSTPLADLWAAFGRLVTRHHVAVTVLGVIVFVFGLFGIPKIQTSVHLLKMFDEDSRIINDYAYLENHFGKLVPMEVVIRVPTFMIANHEGGQENQQDGESATDRPTPMHPLNVLQRAEAVKRIDAAVERTLGEVGTGVIGQTMSAATFFPPLPEPSNSYSWIRARYEAELRASLEELKTSDYYRVESNGPFAGAELWRLSLRVGALSDVDYGQFVGDLRKTVTPVLDAYRARELILTGIDRARANVDGTGAAAEDNRTTAPRVLLIGSSAPKPIAEAEFLKINDPGTRQQEIQLAVHQGLQSDLIRSDQLYLSTLGELLRGERMQTPVWRDFDAPANNIEPGSPRWQRLLDACDLVVLVGDQQAVDMQLLEQSGRPFLDLRPERLPVTSPLLIADIPTEENAGPLQAIYSGIVPVVYKAQRTLLESLIESTVLAFFLIAFVMILLLIPGRFPRSFLSPRAVGIGTIAGFTAMLPNLFPVVVIFGMMGHTGTLVDIGTMMTASVAMGVAVDDTIHFLTWFRQYLDRGYSRVEAIIETYRRVGPAMTQTTMVGGLGLYVFALSTFTPTQRFGTLMLVLLATALIGDLILLPAILAGPLGRWFRPRTVSPGSSPEDGSPANFGEQRGVVGERKPVDVQGSAVAAADVDGVEEDAVIASAAHRPPPSPKGNRQGAGRQSVSGEHDRGEGNSGQES